MTATSADGEPTFREIAEKRGWSVSGLGFGGPR